MLRVPARVPRRLIRFGVGGSNITQSPLYGLVTSRGTDGVYVFTRSLGGVPKVSLHASGDFRMAFTEEFAESRDYDELTGRKDRVGGWSAPRGRPQRERAEAAGLAADVPLELVIGHRQLVALEELI